MGKSHLTPAQAAGAEYHENLIVNRGHYFLSPGERDDAPTTYSTIEEASRAWCERNGVQPSDATQEFAFDVKMLATVRVTAESEAEARRMLLDALDYAEANLGAWPDGEPILCGMSLDGEANLIEIDGEDV